MNPTSTLRMRRAPAWSYTHLHGQGSLIQAGNLKYLIRESHRRRARQEQDAWIDEALVEESFELIIIRDESGSPVAALEIVRSAEGTTQVTQRAALPDLEESPHFRDAVVRALRNRIESAAPEVLLVRGPAVESALEHAGWHSIGYGGRGRHLWSASVPVLVPATGQVHQERRGQVAADR